MQQHIQYKTSDIYVRHLAVVCFFCFLVLRLRKQTYLIRVDTVSSCDLIFVDRSPQEIYGTRALKKALKSTANRFDDWVLRGQKTAPPTAMLCWLELCGVPLAKKNADHELFKMLVDVSWRNWINLSANRDFILKRWDGIRRPWILWSYLPARMYCHLTNESRATGIRTTRHTWSKPIGHQPHTWLRNWKEQTRVKEWEWLKMWTVWLNGTIGSNQRLQRDRVRASRYRVEGKKTQIKCKYDMNI